MKPISFKGGSSVVVVGAGRNNEASRAAPPLAPPHPAPAPSESRERRPKSRRPRRNPIGATAHQALDAELASVNMPYKFNYVRQHVIALISQSSNLRLMTGTLWRTTA